MRISVNDEPLDLDCEVSVAGLLAMLGHECRFVAVALDGEVIARQNYDCICVGAGARVIIVAPMQGG